ncbi:DUF6431 domain-containing protein [Actinomadura sp. OS1-43]|nr:helix-turn-helix domain-containing protein [Actinomadura sp. OS1-43]MDL4813092.1 DUF6431 domain-containing protein [Actinomadura sp. OS1-43]
MWVDARRRRLHTVEADVCSVERRLASGELACPECGGVLARWGWARERVLRGPGSQRVRVRPRRARCSGCGRSHVLLPVGLLVRRADQAVVIGAALEAKARGLGHRQIAVALGRPETTVRGWLRRFASSAGPIRQRFTSLIVAVAGSSSPVLPAPAGSLLGDAVAAVLGAARAVAGRFAGRPAVEVLVNTVSAWSVACAVTDGLLLAPPSAAEMINTSWPLGAVM